MAYERFDSVLWQSLALALICLAMYAHIIYRDAGTHNVVPDTSSQSPTGTIRCVEISASVDAYTLQHLHGATIDRNGCHLINENGSPWLPLTTIDRSEPSQATYDMRLVPVSRQGTWPLTSKWTAEFNATFSGPATARKMCLPAFEFTLPDATIFMLTTVGTRSFFPWVHLPASPIAVLFPVGDQVHANFYRDGSMLLTGPDLAHLAPGKYQIPATCVVYRAVDP